MNRSLLRSLPLLLIASLVLVSCKHKTADMLLINGIIYTANDEQPVAQAVAIKDGKIEAIGQSENLQFEYSSDTIIDLRGEYVYPGFIDAHCHFYGYAMNLGKLNLTRTTSWEEVLTLVDTFAMKNPDGWLIGRGWDQNDWKDRGYPTKKELDEKFPDRPILLHRVDGHAAIANQAALDAAGIDTKTRVEGGKFLKRRGRLTGVLIDRAVEEVEKAMPKPSHADISEALIKAEANLLQVGLTTVDDAGLDLEIIDLIDSLQKAGALKIRVYAMATPTEENFARFEKSGPYKTDRLNVRSFKVYADGALGSRGACLLAPYKDEPRQRGFLLYSEDYYRDIAQRIHEAGFQMNTHCIGDSANRMILKLYGETLGEDNDDRWRIEHSQVIAPEDFELFGRYNVWPSVQPTHATSDMYWAEDRIGKERMKGAYAYKSLFSQNNMIAFGTDFPVEDISPIMTFYAAVGRVDLENYPYGGFNLEEAVGRDTALKAMTIWPATANFEEKEKGSLEVGKVADLVILEDDILYIEQEKLPYIQVIKTIINGEIVYSSDL